MKHIRGDNAFSSAPQLGDSSPLPSKRQKLETKRSLPAALQPMMKPKKSNTSVRYSYKETRI